MKDNFSEINIVPLVDVMLVLIIIILTTASFMKSQSMRVAVPQAVSADATEMAQIDIALTREGDVFVHDEKMTKDAFAGFVENINPESTIMIHADQDVILQKFIDVLDSLKQRGCHRISVQTRK